MDSIKYVANPTEATRERNNAPAPAGRTIERYHYRATLNTDTVPQHPNGRQVLLENVPALLQAMSFH